ncbi:pyruvate dehydrogenase complex dihydrolipoamide acetyltransferase [Nitrospirillum viridazoti]|uniref:Acetyltransferase component of pyruvate dehydrogenase complex n=1 Tax=Nitrospirillum viridazoti CBAmc TaxID=1441467 RepID=A0A248JQ65_9PROT|nr:pyruvate dehydrogenase complex dihydrolipoamide acetyltransferase [Nitrospirillum amazonense]ASG20739.1 pyruvate dehydrogenase complex dihydrolipoamide acetyltransferase [Nitrospirillum amazonense CBAmc]TWB37934.1 pyruvate dehydrogenase E2 component (dihydrolipoamide acetyltransferase) [Nitrospirillum amazonense]
MPIDILMPALSPTMTEGKLAKWVKKEGDTIKAGDVIAEIETDKATMEVEAVDEGTLAKILVPEGTEGVAVNAKIAVLLEEGESADALNAAPPPAAAPAPAKTEAAAPAPAKSEAAPAAATAAPAAAPAHDGKRVFASPLARRMAAQSGLDLAKVSGTGPSGRIVKADVEAALKGGAAKAAPAAAAAPTAAPAAATPAPAAAAAPKGIDAKALADKLGMKYKVLPNSGMRKTIAKRLTEAWQTIPHFGLQVDCEIDALLALRAQLNEKSGEKVSVNDFVVKAVAVALRKVPEANVSWHEDGILQYEGVDVSVAVATDGGLITPIVKNADQKGLATISAEVKSLAAKAKEGKLKPEEFQGGTFSVSNLGMFGIKSFTSIINPPQSCILSVGAGEKRPVVKGDALAVATVMSLTLTVDHRSVDGAVGAKYLQVLKKLIEDPITLML